MHKQEKLIVGIIITIDLILIVLLINAGYLAYLSTSTACFPEKPTNPNTYITGVYSSQSQEICIYINQTEQPQLYDKTYRHELVHQEQDKEGRLYSCDHPFKLWGNELEAYIRENSPY